MLLRGWIRIKNCGRIAIIRLTFQIDQNFGDWTNKNYKTWPKYWIYNIQAKQENHGHDTVIKMKTKFYLHHQKTKTLKPLSFPNWLK